MSFGRDHEAIIRLRAGLDELNSLEEQLAAQLAGAEAMMRDAKEIYDQRAEDRERILNDLSLCERRISQILSALRELEGK